MKKLLLIANPHSGKGQIKKYITDIIDIFNREDYEVSVHLTQGPRDAYKVAKNAGRRYDMIAVSGGDGTLDEVVSGMIEGHVTAPVGYIPTGTTNDFAHSM
ncbi:MAG: acylglycerol kinase family protein, partial [Lachnospiraceae bacterium]|nr:acylglycerol kinase family protein [Lachnospiraceae bacterium]